MLPLLPENNYAAEIMIFGGQRTGTNRYDRVNSIACRESLRIRVFEPNATTSSYTFGDGWVQEDMLLPRVIPDVVLLPNGNVVLLNGAMYGLSGGFQGTGYAYYPNFYAQIYDPYAPVGSRWSTLTRSQIPRFYHSVACLTTNGTILIGCSEPTGGVLTNLTYSRSRYTSELRLEIFFPPFWFAADKPQITSVSSTVVTYDQEFTISFSGTVRKADADRHDVSRTHSILLRCDLPSINSHSDSSHECIKHSFKQMIIPFM